jgi:hypothetical protein
MSWIILAKVTNVFHRETLTKEAQSEPSHASPLKQNPPTVLMQLFDAMFSFK